MGMSQNLFPRVLSEILMICHKPKIPGINWESGLLLCLFLMLKIL
jgi:hypothetical protein